MKKKIIITLSLLIISFFSVSLFKKEEKKEISKDLVAIKLQNENNEYVDSNSFPDSCKYKVNEELTKCDNGGTISYSNGKLMLSSSKAENCFIYFDLVNYENKDNLTDLNANDAYCVGKEEKIPSFEENQGTRFTGKNVNNYICFGTNNKNECLNNNNYLYRVIGSLFTKNDNSYHFKIVMANYYNLNNQTTFNYGNSTWENSTINRILNDNLYNSYSNEYQDMIYSNEYYLCGYNNQTTFKLNELLSYESKDNCENSWKGKIGLIYPSDYGYASGKNFENFNLTDYNDNFINNNWLSSGQDEWTMIYTNTNVYALNGKLITNLLYTNKNSIRPSFYLNNDIIIKSGTGSINDPYILDLEKET